MKCSNISNISGLMLFVAVANFPSAALAYWSAYTDDGTHYGIREGNNKIPLGITEKEAAKAARKVNNALKHDKPDKGVVDPGSGPCHDPGSGVLC